MADRVGIQRGRPDAVAADGSGSNATVIPVMVSASWVSVIVPLAPVALHA